MAVTQYIGSRYVPLFADPVEWSSENTYEALTIVIHDGNSYTSKQAVPKGIDITNEEFWALTGNYNAQVEQYRREVAALGKTVSDHTTAISENTSDIESNTAAINENKSNIESNTSNIESNTAAINENKSDIESNTAAIRLQEKQSNMTYGSVVARIPCWNGIGYDNSSVKTIGDGISGCCIGDDDAFIISCEGGTSFNNNVWFHRCVDGVIYTHGPNVLYHSNCMAFDGDYYYVADLKNLVSGNVSNIVKLDKNFNIVSTVYTSDTPYQPAFDKKTQKLYFIPYERANILEYDGSNVIDTGVAFEYAISETTFGVGQGVGIFDGKVIFPVGYGNGGKVGFVEFEIETGRFLRDFIIINDRFGDICGEPEDCDFDTDGNLYVFSKLSIGVMLSLAAVIKVPLFSDYYDMSSDFNLITDRPNLIVNQSASHNTYATDVLTCTSLDEAIFTKSVCPSCSRGFIKFESDIYFQGFIDSLVTTILTNNHTIHGSIYVRESILTFNGALKFASDSINWQARNCYAMLRTSIIYATEVVAESVSGKRLADKDGGVCGFYFTESNNTGKGGTAPDTLPFVSTYQSN